jgi:hypothetical protein
LENQLQSQEVNLAEIAAKVTEVLADLILTAPPDEQSQADGRHSRKPRQFFT